jgi:hypothetical protein
MDEVKTLLEYPESASLVAFPVLHRMAGGKQ